MKRCAACRRVYDRDAVVCPVDGSTLDDFSSDPRVGQVLAKRYRLVERLGSGSMGAVYLGVELATARRVAVKIFARELRCDEDVLKQCRWDARFATASRPASIVRVHDVDRTDEGQIYVAMDYLEGESLADLLRREGRLELVRALRLASQIAQALAAALSAGVVHSDLKPSNVMVVGPEERIKLTDFGIARLRRIAAGSSLDRPVGVAHEYAAPELLHGGEAVDRTDIYALGAVLYAMLTGAAPSVTSSAVTANGDGPARSSVRMLRPDVPAALEHLLVRAMEREPERRPSSMMEVAERLLDITASAIERQTAAETPVAPPERAPVASPHRVAPPVAPETASRASDEPPQPPQRERGPRQRERLHAAWQACVGTQRALRARWQSRRHAYRDRWRVRREAWQARWQARQAESHARRERRRLAWRAYRVKWRTRRERWQAHQGRAGALLTESRRRAIAVARRRGGEGVRWARAHSRGLASSGAALVVAGAIGWTALSWRVERSAQVPALLSAHDSVSGGELGIDAVSRSLAVAPSRRVRTEIGDAADLTRSRPGVVMRPGDEQNPREPTDTPRVAERVATKADGAPDSTARPAEPAPAVPRVAAALAAPQIARIQTQAEQKLRHRGLLRVSSADRWGVTLETAPSGEVVLGGVLRDMTLYDEAVRLVREVPGVKAVRGSVEVSDVGTTSIVQSDAARIRAEIQQKLRSRGLLRESAADRWGVTVEVNPDGDVMLVGAVRDAEMSWEAVSRAQEVPRVRHVKQDIKVMERDIQQ